MLGSLLGFDSLLLGVSLTVTLVLRTGPAVENGSSWVKALLGGSLWCDDGGEWSASSCWWVSWDRSHWLSKVPAICRSFPTPVWSCRGPTSRACSTTCGRAYADAFAPPPVDHAFSECLVVAAADEDEERLRVSMTFSVQVLEPDQWVEVRVVPADVALEFGANGRVAGGSFKTRLRLRRPARRRSARLCDRGAGSGGTGSR